MDVSPCANALVPIARTAQLRLYIVGVTWCLEAGLICSVVDSDDQPDVFSRSSSQEVTPTMLVLYLMVLRRGFILSYQGEKSVHRA